MPIGLDLLEKCVKRLIVEFLVFAALQLINPNLKLAPQILGGSLPLFQDAKGFADDFLFSLKVAAGDGVNDRLLSFCRDFYSHRNAPHEKGGFIVILPRRAAVVNLPAVLYN
jgi:hypothetical protein